MSSTVELTQMFVTTRAGSGRGRYKAAVDRLDQPALAALSALEARNPTQPPRNLARDEETRGVTDRSVTPRQDLVELRGVEPLTPRLPALCSPN